MLECERLDFVGESVRVRGRLARARNRHQAHVMIGFWRVMPAVVAPITEHRALALGPFHRARVRREADEGTLLGPCLVAEFERGDDVVVAIEFHR